MPRNALVIDTDIHNEPRVQSLPCIIIGEHLAQSGIYIKVRFLPDELRQIFVFMKQALVFLRIFQLLPQLRFYWIQILIGFSMRPADRTHIDVGKIDLCDFAIEDIGILIDSHFFEYHRELFFQHLSHTVFNRVCYDKIENLHISRLPDTIHTTAALFDLHRIPRQIVVDDDIRELQVQAFATGVSRNKDVRVVPEFPERIVAFFNAHSAIQDCHCIPH